MSKALATKNVAAVLLGSVLAFGLAVSVKADTVSDLSAQVQALLAQIAALQGGSSTVATGSTASASCHTFTRNQKVGNVGGEVMWIQQFLNGDSATTVASSGAGSKGNETSKFGPATKAAVIKFQQKYASDILAPVGLTKGTGIWGPSTRAKANALCASAGTTGTTGGTTGTTVPAVAGPVSVVLAASQPTGTIIAGQAAANLGNLTLAGNGTVQTLKLQRTGISTDTTLKNVYLYEGNVRVSDSASIVNGVIAFNSVNLVVAGVRNVSVRGDVDTVASTNVASGNTIGFNVLSITPAGGTEVQVTGVNGPVLTISTLSNPATVNVISAPTPSAQSINAGTTGYAIWSAPFSIGTRAVNLKAITFKYTGSAATTALTNVKLFIDGVDSGAAAVWSNQSGTNRVGFDFSAAPKSLTTGSHTVELRADIVGGSYRNFTISIENVGDIVAEDSQVAGFNVSTTYQNGNFANVTAGTITVNAGSLTITQDPAFGNTTQVVGGSANATISSYKFQAYGEDVKVQSLSVTPVLTGTTPAAAGLRNVTLYANGGAIGSAVSTWTSGAITYTLGSSLIIPAGTSVIVQVRADLMTSGNVNYTAGTVQANIDAGSNNYYGVSSSQYAGNASQTGQSLTIVGSNVTYGVTSGFTAKTVSPNSSAVKIGSFTLQTGNAEGVTVTNVAVGLTVGAGTSLSNFSNLTVTGAATPVGQPTANNNFSMNDTVTASGSKTYEVFADVSSSAGATATVVPTVQVTYRGATSNVTNTTSSVAGPTITMNSGTLSAVSLDNSSDVAQYIVGGNTGVALSKFKFVATTADIVIKQITFNATSTNGIASVTVGGITKSLVGNSVTVDGLDIAVPNSAAGVVVPVTIALAGVSSQSANTNSDVGVAIMSVQYSSGNTTTTTTTATDMPTNSRVMKLVGTKPAVTIDNVKKSGLAIVGETKLGEVVIAADAAGDVSVEKLVFTVAPSGFTTAPTAVATPILVEGVNGSVNISGNTCTPSSLVVTCEISGGYTITKGTSKTFSLRGALTGAANTGSNKAQVATSVGSSNFVWEDLLGNSNANLTGTLVYGFPTVSYTVEQ